MTNLESKTVQQIHELLLLLNNNIGRTGNSQRAAVLEFIKLV